MERAPVGALSFFRFCFPFFAATVHKLQSMPYTNETSVVPFSTSVERVEKVIIPWNFDLAFVYRDCAILWL